MNFEDLSVKQVRELTQSQLDVVVEKFSKKLYKFLVRKKVINLDVECRISYNSSVHTIKASEQKHVHLCVKSVNFRPEGDNDDPDVEFYVARCAFNTGLTIGPCLALFLYQNDNMHLRSLVFDSWNNPMAPRINFK